MNNKKWVISFILGLLSIMTGIAIFNYCVDPYNYFHSTYGDGYYYVSSQITVNDRVKQYEYIKNNHEKYQGVIIGGSKSHGVDAEYLSQITGIKYYNMSFLVGNFLDYYNYISYIAENTEIDNVFLHLSTREVQSYTEEERNASGNGLETPVAIDTSKSKVKEFVSYLYRGGVKASWSYLVDKINGDLFWKEISEYGTRDDGGVLKKRKQNVDAYINDVVNKEFAGLMNRLLDENPYDMPAIQRNLDALKKIKELCDENGINLQVVIGSTYISQTAKYEGEAYYDYLREMAQITEFWDFSFPNEYNLNPYNFLDGDHMLASTSKKVISHMYGIEQLEDFGIYVTSDNVGEYIEQRKNKIAQIKEEYKEFGELTLGTYFDESYIASDLLYPTQTNIGSNQEKTVSLNDYKYIEQYYIAKKNVLNGVGIYFICEDNAKGHITVELYDVVEDKVLQSQEIDVTKISNYNEAIFLFDTVKTVVAREYCIRISYADVSSEDGEVKVILCSGNNMNSVYTKLAGKSESYQIKMSLYEEVTETEYAALNKEVVLYYDNTTGGEEFVLRGLNGGDVYEQKFIANSESFLYLELYPVTWNYEYSEESEIIIEIYDVMGNLLADKKVTANLLPDNQPYNVIFDRVVPIVKGEQYTIKLSSNMSQEEKPIDVIVMKETVRDDYIVVNGEKFAASLKFKLYGLDE